MSDTEESVPEPDLFPYMRFGESREDAIKRLAPLLADLPPVRRTPPNQRSTPSAAPNEDEA